MFIFADLLIAKHRKTHNSQLIDTRNWNPTYGNIEVRNYLAWPIPVSSKIAPFSLLSWSHWRPLSCTCSLSCSIHFLWSVHCPSSEAICTHHTVKMNDWILEKLMRLHIQTLLWAWSTCSLSCSQVFVSDAFFFLSAFTIIKKSIQ